MNEFDMSDVNLGPAAAKLAHRYFGVLAAMDHGDRLAAEQVWYAAASAAECLQLTHEDLARLRKEGADRTMLAGIKAVGRADAQFYLGLVRDWLATSGTRGASVSSQGAIASAP